MTPPPTPAAVPQSPPPDVAHWNSARVRIGARRRPCQVLPRDCRYWPSSAPAAEDGASAPRAGGKPSRWCGKERHQQQPLQSDENERLRLPASRRCRCRWPAEPAQCVGGAVPAAWHGTVAWQGRWRRADGQRGGIGKRSGWWGGAEEGWRADTVAEQRDGVAMTTTHPRALGNDGAVGCAAKGATPTPFGLSSTTFRYVDASTRFRSRLNLGFP